jgi:voltage-gated potassium channel Kch
MTSKLFSPRHHLPHYTMLLFRSLTQPVLIYFAMVINFFILIACFAFYHFEHTSNPNVQSLFDALWWTITTITTVGFGDVVPVTVPGRLIGMVLMASGLTSFLSFTAILITIFSSLLSEELALSENQQSREIKQLRDEVVLLRQEIQKLINAKTDGRGYKSSPAD